MPTDAEYQTKTKSLDWSGLRSLWQEVKKRETPGWEPGKAFEYLVLRAFSLDNAEVKWPYSVQLFDEEVEQIDGAVYTNGLCCLVESKDVAKGVAIGPIAKLRNQLLRRPAGTIGIMFSSSQFTPPAVLLAHFSLPETILLWEGREMEYALENEKMCDYLALKYHACVELAIPDFSITEKVKS